MHHLTSFVTAQFDPANETPNDINPIAGEGVLIWLRVRLVDAGYEVTEPETEDWGWYVYAGNDSNDYLVGASGETEYSDSNIEWIVQVHKMRSFKEKLFRRNKLTADDPLSLFVQRLVDQETEFRNVSHWSE